MGWKDTIAPISNEEQKPVLPITAPVAYGPGEQAAQASTEILQKSPSVAQAFTRGFLKVPLTEISPIERPTTYGGAEQAAEYTGEVFSPAMGGALKLGKYATKLPGVSKAASAGKEVFYRHAGSVIADFNKASTKAMLNMTTMYDKYGKPILYKLKQKMSEIGEFAVKNNILKNSLEDTAQAALESKEKIGGGIETILDASKAPILDAGEEVYKPIKKAMEQKMRNAPQSASKNFQSVIDEFSYLENDKWKSTKDLWEIRQKFDDAINWNPMTATTKDKAMKQARGIIDSVINQKIEKQLGSDAFNRYNELQGAYQKANAIEKAAARGSAGEALTVSDLPIGGLGKKVLKAAIPGARTLNVGAKYGPAMATGAVRTIQPMIPDVYSNKQ